MEFSVYVCNCYAERLNELARLEAALRHAKKKERKALKLQVSEKVTQLFGQARQDFPSPLGWTRVVTALVCQLESTNEAVAKLLRAECQRFLTDTPDFWNQDIERCNLQSLVSKFEKPEPDLATLPGGSWFLQFEFVLNRPLISRDEGLFYLIDNPVSKDRVLGLPLIRASAWKGNLRHSLRLLKSWDADDRPEMVRLFGNPRGAVDGFRSGRLHFYPTFFRHTRLEVINPHDRLRNVGKNPIPIECVRENARGTFSLLYVPFDLIGKGRQAIVDEARADLLLVAEAVSAMMLVYGFSAKRTSGYGAAEDLIKKGVVKTHALEKKLTHLSKLVEEVADVGF